MDASNALKNWQLQNQIITVEEPDQIYYYDRQKQQQILSSRPWTKDPHYFTKVMISAVALIKMVMHARSGGSIEIMGLMQGKISGDTMIVMDAFALPVQGTETRVNAQQEGNEYMVTYIERMQEIGRHENVIGWYHSHPGYGCWLSGIDVSTQMLNQQYQEPFLAVVIDPNRTISAGKVELGAFRTYPQGYKPPDEEASEYQTIPLDKIEDFGVHCKQYYQLEVTYFKSKLDTQLLSLLWNKYWVHTLSQSPLLTNRDFMSRQMMDLAEKIDQADTQYLQSGRMGIYSGGANGEKRKSEETQLTRINRDSCKISCEAARGLMSQVIKNMLFNKSN
ncbi:uncharacterized protein VTP21DRAFT_6383 [Calcarisporiella thermophila]|uniref:uncharacterized protein n=1 Tax=Calcarisporiella thermophila TaxID=911321 RepID=UPI0037434ACD